MTDILKYKSHLIPLVLYILSWHLISKAKNLTPLSGIKKPFLPFQCHLSLFSEMLLLIWSCLDFSKFLMKFGIFLYQSGKSSLQESTQSLLLLLTFPWTPNWAKVDAVTSMFPELLTYSYFIAYESPFHLSQCSADTGTWFVSTFLEDVQNQSIIWITRQVNENYHPWMYLNSLSKNTKDAWY